MTTEESCSRHCGYVSSGRDLIDHEIHEHRPCPDCGAGKDDGQSDGRLEYHSLSHTPDCPRLRPGYVYPSGPDQDRPDSWYDYDPDEGYEFRSGEPASREGAKS